MSSCTRLTSRHAARPHSAPPRNSSPCPNNSPRIITCRRWLRCSKRQIPAAVWDGFLTPWMPELVLSELVLMLSELELMLSELLLSALAILSELLLSTLSKPLEMD